MMQRQNHAIKISAKNRCVFRKREMHRFFFLKKATEETSSKTGEADWLCFCCQLLRRRSTEGCNPFVLGTGVQRPVGVKGQPPHRVKGETPCPRRIVALRQFVLGSTCRKIRRFSGFAAASLRGNFAKIGGRRIETDTTQWQSRKKRNL